MTVSIDVDQPFLATVKAEYEILLKHYANFEIAESFFNSVSLFSQSVFLLATAKLHAEQIPLSSKEILGL